MQEVFGMILTQSTVQAQSNTVDLGKGESPEDSIAGIAAMLRFENG